MINSIGALLSSVPKDDDPASLDFVGSTIVVVAESVEQVREQLSKDIYATSGVWDMEKVSIVPHPRQLYWHLMLNPIRSRSIPSNAPSGTLE